jgi:hypothetical protein
MGILPTWQSDCRGDNAYNVTAGLSGARRSHHQIGLCLLFRPARQIYQGFLSNPL